MKIWWWKSRNIRLTMRVNIERSAKKRQPKTAAFVFSGCLRCFNQSILGSLKIEIERFSAVYKLVRVFGFACAVVMVVVMHGCTCLHGFHGYGDFLRFGVFEFEI